MKSKKCILSLVVALSMILSLFTVAVSATAGDNLWISETAWGQLIDPTGAAILPTGDQITIPVTITSAQGTILVTVPGTGATDEEKSMPLKNETTGLYTNVVYLDTVNAPTSGSVYNYTFRFDSALVSKGQKLYVKVGGTDLPAGDHQKATTTYLGAVMPSGSYTAANVSDDLVITTPSANWTNPTVSVTVSEGGLTKDISNGIIATATSITIPNSALKAAFTEISSGNLAVTSIKVSDSIIEDISIVDLNIAVSIATHTISNGDVNGDGLINILDVIMVAEIAVGYIGSTPEQLTRANVSDKTDMTVDISDVVLIIERAVGGTTPFPVDLP